MEKTLTAHITQRIQAGAHKSEIEEDLIAVGWQEGDVEKAYAEALVALGFPTPSAGVVGYGASVQRATTLEIVLNFFSFILLGISATALGTLLFEIINHYFPDALNTLSDYYYYNATSDTIHYATAAIVIAFPLYCGVMRFWFSTFRRDEGKREARLSKWLTYLVLLVASVTVVGDLIVVVYTLLQGEITARFLLKALTILTIAGAIFGFYFYERKAVQYKKPVTRSLFQVFGWVFSVAVLIAVVLGFVVAGSPMTARKKAFDMQRAQDLSTLVGCVSSYAQSAHYLPDSLTTLQESERYSYCSNAMQDSETKTPYEYRVLSPLVPTAQKNVYEGSVELCATFSLDSQGTENQKELSKRYVINTTSNKWYIHGKGRSCDTEKIRVNVYTSETTF